MKTEDDNKLISKNKENYYIPMYNDERWEKDLMNEKYIHQKVLNRSFIMTRQVLENLKIRNKSQGNINASSKNIGNASKYNNTTRGNKFIQNATNIAKDNPTQANQFVNHINQYVYTKHLLRMPEQEISKEILIEKEKKEFDKKHPIKIIAKNLRDDLDDEY